jgi:hypothetical protein
MVGNAHPTKAAGEDSREADPPAAGAPPSPPWHHPSARFARWGMTVFIVTQTCKGNISDMRRRKALQLQMTSTNSIHARNQ